MKNLIALLALTVLVVVFSCKKEESERFRLLTGPVWTTDSLLANGIDASGPAGLLGKFKGDAKFKTDGSGYFGAYKGTWMFSGDETQIVIASDSLPIPIVTNIRELTSVSLKVTAVVPNPVVPQSPFNVRLTFKAR